MMVVGLGKQTGAESVHSDGLGNMARNLPANARVVLERSSILFAIPCVENAYDETSIIEAIPREAIMDREPELLKTAFSNMPGILVGEADVLIVNEMGKNFSGTGVDPNISGTWSTEFGKGGLKVKRTCFLDLTDCSHAMPMEWDWRTSLPPGSMKSWIRKSFILTALPAQYYAPA